MNPNMASGNQPDSPAPAVDMDATLRLIANLPAPQGLEDRIHAALRSAPRTARVFEWPVHLRAESPWIRGAAAATIAFIVVGGGWGVYSRVQPARVIAMPPHVASPGGFSNAGDMSIPKTLNGPVVNHPPAAPHVVQMPARHGQSNPAAKKPGPAQAK